MALGARDRQVVWTVARGVAALIGIGTGVGLTLAVLAMLALRAVSAPATGLGNIAVYRPHIDPVALLGIAGVMALVGVVAAFVPARRAARMHPLVALRHEQPPAAVGGIALAGSLRRLTHAGRLP